MPFMGLDATSDKAIGQKGLSPEGLARTTSSGETAICRIFYHAALALASAAVTVWLDVAFATLKRACLIVAVPHESPARSVLGEVIVAFRAVIAILFRC